MSKLAQMLAEAAWTWARVRSRVSLLAAEPQSGGRVLLKLQCTLQIEGEGKPALVAEMMCMLIGSRDASA